ncbi:GMC oxidoreductase-domain-containing protein [Armillaria luteobubalina]|uniref:GMC oxidoreductase-domain-containing protein n=1 Tax=Armillaria luteobubalina TaxID=153913 RepID=A0AA39TQQ0_9AGAR|nr:GMC oxidoreductase-domain-containing protein [Armillaria luteobubalina]
MAPHTIESNYDVIFAGGGTTACMVAGRLTKADPNLKILILEAGPTTKDKIDHIQPGRYITHLAPDSRTMQFYESKASEHMAGRGLVVPSARCVGGGASVNFVLYNRPAASDFDTWETEYSNPGWGSKDLIPLLQKAETYEVDPTRKTHGSSGPIKVSFGGNPSMMEICKQFLEVGPQYEKDRRQSEEGNNLDPESLNCFFRMPKFASSNGRRSDTATHYLYNQDSKNVTLCDGTRVKRVLFEGTKAVGVEYVFDKQVYPDVEQSVRTVLASRLIVLSAGAMGSPLVLERSGIGAASVLDKAGIKQLVDLPGVGKEYDDHPFLVTPYFVDPNVTTYDRLFRGDAETWGENIAQWDADGSGLLGANGVDASIKFRPLEHEVEELGPDFKEVWKKDYANKPDRPLFWMSALAGLPADQSTLPPISYFCSGVSLGYPVSRGHLHITSDDIYATPDFDCGFLSHPADVAVLRWGYKRAREILRRMPVYRGAFAPAHPHFDADSPAGISLAEDGPVPLDAPKIVYTKKDNDAIDANIRSFVGTTWHSLGTCPMKPRERGGVVDTDLNVYGVTGLKIADLSIAPSNVNCNTYSATLAIGEKTALIIAKELGIEGV